MKRLTDPLQKVFFPLILTALTAILAWKNYVSGTILSGWDTLHPEFNIGLYLKRIFFGVWQEHQGVGAVAAQSHVAELSRLPLIWIESLVLPENLVRYTFFFICIVVGVLGVYFISEYLLQRQSEKFARAAAFLASVFYLLNLTTVQQFSVPLEMFAVHFAAVPWLFYWLIRYIRESDRKNLIWFSVTTIFSSSMAHTATLYYVYIAALALFLLSVCMQDFTKEKVKKALLIFGITLLLNAYWILPNLYFIKNHAQEVADSKIHSVFSGEAFLQSKNYGTLKDLVLQKNFLFNWRAFDFSKNEFTDLLGVWKDHLQKPYVAGIGYSFFALAFVGFFISVFKKSKYHLSLLLPLVLCVIFWINANGPLENIFNFLRQNSTLFSEGLRFPFTKFSIILVFILSIYLSVVFQFVLKALGKFKIAWVFVFVVLGVNIYFALPAFKGYLIEPNMKINIPNEYSLAFDWFSGQDPNARVVKLPMNTMWGWNYYSWGYEGAGFTWFGIPQATLDREFDRWSKFNEDFYTQSTFALYANDNQGFEDSLKKYQVRYLLLDESVVNPGGDQGVLYIPEIKDLISKSAHIKEAAKFGFLTVYQTDFDEGNNYVSAPRVEYGNYFQPENIQKTGEILKEDLSVNRGFEIAYNCDLEKVGSAKKKYTSEGILYTAENGGVSCDYLSYPDFKYSQAFVLKIAGENKQGRSLKIYLTNYKTGRSDLEELLPEGKFEKEFIIYPSGLPGEGYSLNFETRSFGRITSENLLSKVEFYPAEYNLKDNVDTVNNNLKILDVKKYGTWAYKIDTEGSGLMQLGQGHDPGWIAMPTWNLLFTIYHLPFLEHVKVNSWANGWIVPSNLLSPFTLYLVYWPQLLEWGGIILGLIALILIVV